MATPKQAHALITYFTQQYKEKYGVSPRVNRHASRWGIDSMLEDLETTEVKELIDYYLTTINTSGHTIDWFLWNYEKLMEAKERQDEDRKALALVRERSRVRTEEYRRRKNG